MLTEITVTSWAPEWDTRLSFVWFWERFQTSQCVKAARSLSVEETTHFLVLNLTLHLGKKRIFHNIPTTSRTCWQRRTELWEQSLIFIICGCCEREESITIWRAAQRLLFGGKKKPRESSTQISSCFQIFLGDAVPRSSFWELTV